MGNIFIFGMGYSARVLAGRLTARGWTVSGTSRGGGGLIPFGDRAAVLAAVRGASHILSSVPPGDDGRDPVLDAYGAALAVAPARWVGYFSATGVYGDCGGAWVDESAAIGRGRRTARAAADAAWQALRGDVRVLRLPGIYGPGRSVLDRIRSGQAKRIAAPGQMFSRVHVDDIAAGTIASFAGPPGIYHLADDLPCSANQVTAYGCALLGLPLPPLVALAEANLSPMARDFYAENRRIANHKAQRLLRWRPAYPTYREGLLACLQSGG